MCYVDDAGAACVPKSLYTLNCAVQLLFVGCCCVSDVIDFRLEIVIITSCTLILSLFRSSCPCRVFVDYYFFVEGDDSVRVDDWSLLLAFIIKCCAAWFFGGGEVVPFDIFSIRLRWSWMMFSPCLGDACVLGFV